MGSTGMVAILFTDLVGSTAVVAALGERRADEIRQAHFSLLRESIRDHSGTEVKNLGDGLMVAFAAASDAVACAVAMQQALKRHNRRAADPVEMRVSVAAGEATREESDYFGTPVIEAARVCAAAAGGQILVTEMARALTGTRGGHRFDALGPMELKGLPEPVPVHEVRWEQAAGDAPPLPARLPVDRSSTFVGRASEREFLEAAWKRAEEANRQVVLVAGEAGMGKTRLATEAALHAHTRGGLVLMGTCDEDLAVPYQPFVEALRDLVSACPVDVLTESLAERGGELTRLLPELARRIPDTPPPQASDPETERYLLFSAVVELLAAVSRWRPVLLLLDDLHWATKPTLLLLKHLIRFREPLALLVVGTYRDSDIGRGHPFSELLADSRRESGIERLTLRGLSDAESIALMETLAGQDLDGTLLQLAHAVYAEADGSPFFMRELLRHFIEAGELTQEGDRWTYRGELSTLGIPDSVREVIGHRISRLPDPVDRLLRLGAVIGREFDLTVLAPLAGLDRAVVAEALGAAGKAALVREVVGSPGRFTFAHALIRHTIYDELGPARRMELHRRVAETFESLGHGDDYLSELALHWAAATPGAGVVVEDRDKAAGYAHRAGVRAMGSLAYEEAVHHFEDALRTVRLGGDPLRICDLLTVLGEAQRCAGDPAHRETLLDAGRIALEVGDAERAARAALANQRGGYSRIGTIDRERVGALEAALEAVGPAATAVRARLLAALATELQFTGDERRLQLGREALGIARQLEDPATLAQVVAAVWFATWGPAPASERRPMVAELAELAARLEDRTHEFQAAFVAFLTAGEEADMEAADAALATCERVADELGQPLLRWRTIHLKTNRAIAAGRLDEADSLGAEGRRLGEAIGQSDSVAFRAGSFSLVRTLQGRPAEVAEMLLPVVAQFPALNYPAALAWARAEEGRIDEAADIVADLRARISAEPAPDYLRLAALCILARAVHRLGDTAAAGELHRLLLPHEAAICLGLNIWIGPVAHDLALLETVLGRYDAADEHFAAAVGLQDRIGARGTVIHSRLEWAAMLLQRDHGQDRDRARVLLDQARAGCREVGLPRIEQRIDELEGRLPDP